MSTQLGEQAECQRNHEYDETDNSSLDGYLSSLLLQPSKLASAEDRALSSACAEESTN